MEGVRIISPLTVCAALPVENFEWTRQFRLHFIDPCFQNTRIDTFACCPSCSASAIPILDKLQTVTATALVAAPLRKCIRSRNHHRQLAEPESGHTLVHHRENGSVYQPHQPVVTWDQHWGHLFSIRCYDSKHHHKRQMSGCRHVP